MCNTPKLTVGQVLDTLQNRIKIVICGDGAVGKTCVLMGYALKFFPTDYVPTVFDNYHLEVTIEGREVDVEIVDTAGQEDFFEIRKLGYKGAHVLIICYDISNIGSFKNVKDHWVPELRGKGGATASTPLVLAGTKADLRNPNADFSGPFVGLGEAKRLARSIGAAGPIECSALTHDKLGDLFNLAIKKAISDRQQQEASCSLL